MKLLVKVQFEYLLTCIKKKKIHITVLPIHFLLHRESKTCYFPRFENSIQYKFKFLENLTNLYYLQFTQTFDVILIRNCFTNCKKKKKT